MKHRLTADAFYDVTDKEEFSNRLLNDVDVKHEVIGIEVASIGDNTCSVRFVPTKKMPREYSVSSQVLREMYQDSIIELKERDV